MNTTYFTLVTPERVSRTSVILIIICVGFCTSLKSHAREVSDHQQTQAALTETQTLLKDQKKLEAEGLTTPEAKKAHQQAKDLMGNAANTEALYSLTSDIMGSLVKEAGNDPAKLQELLAKAMKDPNAFASKLTPDQLARLKELSKKVEAQRR